VDTGDMTKSGIVVTLLEYLAIGAILLVQALLHERRSRAGAMVSPTRLGLREAMGRYVGPVHPDLALLNAPGRVALEFVASFCGFPGFGWLASTRVGIGLPMMVLGPAIVFGFYPAYLALSGHFVDRPMIALEYLPVVAVLSATTLAIAEVRRARAAHDGAQD
jgi:hypothetical protein